MTTEDKQRGAEQQDPSHDEVWLLIPWYVNGTLEPEERQAVERLAATDPEIAAEIRAQSRLAEAVSSLDEVDAVTERSWSGLAAAIAAEQAAPAFAAPAPQPAPRGGISAWIERFWGATREQASRLGTGPLALGGGLGACAMAAVAVVMVFSADGPAPIGTQYDTLTNPAAQEAGAVVRLKVAEGVSEAELAALVGAHGLEIASAPSDGGVYTLVARPGEDAAAAVAALDGLPEVLFVGLRTQP